MTVFYQIKFKIFIRVYNIRTCPLHCFCPASLSVTKLQATPPIFSIGFPQNLHASLLQFEELHIITAV